MEKKSNGTDSFRPKMIGIHRLAEEISLGLRSPVTIRAGEVYGGIPGYQLPRLHTAMADHNSSVATGKEGMCGKT